MIEEVATPESILDRKEMREEILSVMDKLHPRQRAAIYGHVFLRLSFIQLGRYVGRADNPDKIVSAEMAKQLFERGMRVLRRDYNKNRLIQWVYSD